ncbi:MAG: TrkA family potassium uptake protein [Actinomycetota bacterium]|nr:TrkA family potassium uptake protein [Actinomycetota bacterium]
MAKTKPVDPVLVIGLGRFGSAVAEALVNLGHEVLAVDENAARVQQWSGRLTSVAQADTTSEEALRQLGAAEFARAVVCIGSDVEASILTVGVLVDLSIPCIWAKALTRPHGRILERVGATKVVYPEHDMGERVAHMVTGRMIDYIEFDEGFALVEASPPKHVVGKTLGESGIRRDHGVTVVCIKDEGHGFTYATKDSLISRGSLLIVAGKTDLVERFANLV